MSRSTVHIAAKCWYCHPFCCDIAFYCVQMMDCWLVMSGDRHWACFLFHSHEQCCWALWGWMFVFPGWTFMVTRGIVNCAEASYSDWHCTFPWVYLKAPGPHWALVITRLGGTWQLVFLLWLMMLSFFLVDLEPLSYWVRCFSSLCKLLRLEHSLCFICKPYSV